MARSAAPRMFALLASAVRAAASVIAALILVHAVFVLFKANPGNELVQFTGGVRDTFGWFTENLFTASQPRFSEAINDALAAVVYLVAGNLVSKMIVRVSPASRAKA